MSLNFSFYSFVSKHLFLCSLSYTLIPILSVERIFHIRSPLSFLDAMRKSYANLFVAVDEPTSGLDSQTSWIICDLLEKLRKGGQAILCTVHQPSSNLFQHLDRLLFLASGGKTVYYGDIGENSQILTEYFTRNGASPCPPGANPAEWMLEIIGAAPGSKTKIDWPSVWKSSTEYEATHAELQKMKQDLPSTKSAPSTTAAIGSLQLHLRLNLWQLLDVFFNSTGGRQPTFTPNLHFALAQ